MLIVRTTEMIIRATKTIIRTTKTIIYPTEMIFCPTTMIVYPTMLTSKAKMTSENTTKSLIVIVVRYVKSVGNRW
jgi:hypothetical protein